MLAQLIQPVRQGAIMSQEDLDNLAVEEAIVKRLSLENTPANLDVVAKEVDQMLDLLVQLQNDVRARERQLLGQ